MTFDEAFYNKVTNDYSTKSVYYGSAEEASGQYHVMYKISDLERPIVLVDSQGESGVALYQFTTYGGDSAGELMNVAEVLKDAVATIKGEIGTTYKFRIYDNKTQGVRVISDGYNEQATWGVIFESEISWEAV
jgi:hypothetical protein